MIIAEELKSEREKRLIKDHKKRMYDMRFFGLEWQEIHQKRWDENAGCNENICDCEELKKLKELDILYDDENGNIIVAYVYDEELKEKRMLNRKELDKLRNES
jgi:hypothetical protein